MWAAQEALTRQIGYVVSPAMLMRWIEALRP